MATTKPKLDLDVVLEAKEIIDARKFIDQILVKDAIKDYIVDLIYATRTPKDFGVANLETLIEFGASPRATIALTLAAKAHAFLRGRSYVETDDVKLMAPDVLRHRILPSYEAEAEGYDSDDLIQMILGKVAVP